MMKKNLIVLVITAFILSNCQNTKDQFLIKEGLGVSGYKLKTKKSDSPRESEDITLLFNRDNVIYAIDITSDVYYTKDDLKVGMDYETILKHRGMYNKEKIIDKARSSDKDEKEYPFSMRYDGITFFLNDDGTVSKIRIY